MRDNVNFQISDKTVSDVMTKIDVIRFICILFGMFRTSLCCQRAPY